MTKNTNDPNSEIIYLLKYLLAVELHRGGLTKAQVRERLKLDNNLVSKMLSGLSQPKSED